MKVKEIDRTANLAWSPSAHHPIYLAAGTAAQQLDATFSTTAALEIYDLNLSEPGLDMTLKGSIVSDYRFHKVVWGSYGMKSDRSSGILVGGADGGNILMYDPVKLLNGEDALLYHKTSHSGPVNSLDFNKFQDCLLASGSSDSEISIWDLNNPTSPMTPGTKSQPTEDVTSVAWNCQVQHILASTFPSRCVVWDLRKNEPIIKVSDSASRIRCKIVAWHPEVATQLCLASDDDHYPLIQLWDLRFATTPVRNLEQHQRGVLAIAWCPQDPDLLLSCGKDNRILCWNPNSSLEGGEIICELPTSNQWSFDVAWCPRNPAVIASSSCDGHVCAHSLMGGQSQVQCSSKIAESFPGSERIVQPQISAHTQMQNAVYLKKPPKWLRRSFGASFSFGGKLISFGVGQASDEQNFASVLISQVVTEPKLLNKVFELETALNNRNIAEFCHNKAAISENSSEKMRWNFLEATFAASPRAKMLSLLGYDYQHVQAAVSEDTRRNSLNGTVDVTGKMAKLEPYRTSPHPDTGDSADFDTIAEQSKAQIEEQFSIITDGSDTSALLNRALLTGNIELAVELCLSDGRWADALVLAQAGGHELLQKTQKLYFKSVITSSSKLISAVATSNWTSVVMNCDLSCWKETLAAILTYAKPEEFAHLCELLGNRLETEKGSSFLPNAALCYISSGNLERYAELCFKNHRESLNDALSLEAVVEQLMVLRQAVEQLSGSAPPVESGAVSTILGKFAGLLASQGNLKSALMYLVDSKERSLAILRDRIYQSLGLPSPYFPFERVEVPRDQTASAMQQERKQSLPLSTRPSYVSAPKEPVQPSVYSSNQQFQQFQPYAPNVLQPSSSGPAMPSFAHPSNIQQYQVPQPAVQHAPSTAHISPPPSNMPLTTPVPASVPPPPPSTDTPNVYGGKSASGHTLSQRYPKHLHDPSVYSENTFMGQQQYYHSQSYAPTQPEMPYNQQNVPQQPTSFYSTEQSMTPAFSANSNVCVPAQYSSSTSYNAYPPQAQPPAPSEPLSSEPPMLSGAYGDIKTGWNDPPLLKHAATGGSSTYMYQPQSAITTPFPNAVGPEMMQPSTLVPSTSTSYYNPPPFTSQTQAMPVNQPVDPPVPEQSAMPVTAAPKEKLPIPYEHRIIQETLEDLKKRCLQVASNPQTRRKLEDVSKKLQSLYDSLREKSLSSPVQDGLHQIVQSIVQGDYSAALAVQSMLVSSSNFSEICSFMPSVKVLVQTAAQNGVYLN